MGQLELGGEFYWMILDRAGEVTRWGSFHNSITGAALNAILDAYFNEGTQPAGFYIGLIDNDSYSELDSDDTMSSHSGWIENTDYSQAARPQWNPSAAASGLLAGAAACEYTMTAAADIAGMFVTTDDTKGGTDGLLWSHGEFSVVQSMQVGETLKCFYELEARSG
jgi:hypothetical protein